MADLYRVRISCNTCGVLQSEGYYPQTWTPACWINAEHVINPAATSWFEPLIISSKKDADGRLITVTNSGDMSRTTQWLTRGDELPSQQYPTGRRNFGPSGLLTTSGTRCLMDPTLALTNTAASEQNPNAKGSYVENAMHHNIFSNTPDLAFYAAEFGGTNWKRKRARIQVVDDLQCRAMHIHYSGGIPEKVFAHAYVFWRNYGYLPPMAAATCTPYNPAAAHNESTNPIGWPCSTYAEELPLIRASGVVDYVPEYASCNIPSGNAFGNMIEFWFELTYDADAFTSEHCAAFCRLFAYSEGNIHPIWA
jgi:hypothetical protein